MNRFTGTTNESVHLPDVGVIDGATNMVQLKACGDGRFRVGRDGVEAIVGTGDGKVEFIAFEDRTLAYVKSATGYPAYYPVHPVRVDRPIRAVLMDLDGTSVRSESFWIWIIERTTASLLDRPDFELDEADVPHVSGHSVSEHLQYCIGKYCPDKTLEEARDHYFRHTRREMKQTLAGRGRVDAFTPTPGLKEFLHELKSMGIRIGLVTSGLYEKAYPEIASAMRTLKLGEPEQVYDTIITAGFPLRDGQVGTLGELSSKPHPWLYAEACRVGLGIPFDQRHRVIGIEDSGAGVCAIRLAGFMPIGLAGGNIEQSGTQALCGSFCGTLEDVLQTIKQEA